MYLKLLCFGIRRWVGLMARWQRFEGKHCFHLRAKRNKIEARARHIGIKGEVVTAPITSHPRHQKEVGGQPTPRLLFPGERTDRTWWLGPRTCLDVSEKQKTLVPAGIRTTNRPARSVVASGTSVHLALCLFTIYTPVHQTTVCNIAGDNNIHNQRCDNLKSHTLHHSSFELHFLITIWTYEKI